VLFELSFRTIFLLLYVGSCFVVVQKSHSSPTLKSRHKFWVQNMYMEQINLQLQFYEFYPGLTTIIAKSKIHIFCTMRGHGYSTTKMTKPGVHIPQSRNTLMILAIKIYCWFLLHLFPYLVRFLPLSNYTVVWAGCNKLQRCGVC
jgi:hypothetical protein